MTHCTKMLLLHDARRLIPILFHSKTHTNLIYDLGHEYSSNVGNVLRPICHGAFRHSYVHQVPYDENDCGINVPCFLSFYAHRQKLLEKFQPSSLKVHCFVPRGTQVICNNPNLSLKRVEQEVEKTQSRLFLGVIELRSRLKTRFIWTKRGHCWERKGDKFWKLW